MTQHFTCSMLGSDSLICVTIAQKHFPSQPWQARHNMQFEESLPLFCKRRWGGHRRSIHGHRRNIQTILQLCGKETRQVAGGGTDWPGWGGASWIGGAGVSSATSSRGGGIGGETPAAAAASASNAASSKSGKLKALRPLIRLFRCTITL